MNSSIYLSQSYADAWEDYRRALSDAIPVWDYIILTASNEHQARSFRLQAELRKAYLPARTRFAVIPDEGGVRVGSGGATLSVLKYLRERESSFRGLRILVIHSGGDSKRVPQYSALGKLFSPVPRKLPDGRCSTLFDEFIISMSAVPARIREGMLLLSGDVLLLFNPLLIDYSGSGAAAISFKESVEIGKDHGVYLRGADGYVSRFLHKQSVKALEEIGAVNDRGQVDIDTGALILGSDVLGALYSLISTDGRTDERKYSQFVNDRVRLSLYGDFQYPMASGADLASFYLEKPEGEDSEELRKCRESVWKALHPFRMKLLRLAPARFIHFGTSREVLHLVTEGVAEYEMLGWSGNVHSAGRVPAAYNAVVRDGAKVGTGAYIEMSCLHGNVSVGEGSIISYVELDGVDIPPHVVLHGLKQADGNFVVRIYGVEDNPKECFLFGQKLTGDLWEEGEEHTLWSAHLYPEKKTIREAVESALCIYQRVMRGEAPEKQGKSLAEGFNDADPEALLAWDQRMAELVDMEDISRMIRENQPVKELGHLPSLSPAQKKWFEKKCRNADFSFRMRLHYYLGCALGDDTEIAKAFQVLSHAMTEGGLPAPEKRVEKHIRKEDVKTELPLRVNFGGGWSDTPPYCNEHGGTVLNAAITLNGERPVQVRIRRIPEHKIIFDSRDMDVHGEFEDIAELVSVGDPYDHFVLQKAVLLACGVIGREDTNLDSILSAMGGGFLMNTEVIGVPKGSGLGTSSILAAACVMAVYEFIGEKVSEDRIYATVLMAEQIMSTGGGWQDQVGGVTDGIKYITSKPGLKQELRVTHVALDREIRKELNDRYALIYTGQRRLARNLLRDVVGRYIGNEPDAVYALNEIQRNAALQRFELERGNIDAFADLMTQHWELSKLLDQGSTNTLIDQIFDVCSDLLAGRMICGAGGGGFLQVVLKKGIKKEELQNRLRSVFSDTDIGVWDCELV